MNILTNLSINQNYVAITPIKIRFNDTVNASRLYIVMTKDNLLNECTFAYTLRSDTNKILLMGDTVMKGTDYTNWDSSTEAAFTFVATHLTVTII